MTDAAAEQVRQVRLVQDAFDRGHALLVQGDKVEALRWLDRAHRLAPADATIALFLASALIGEDNPKAAAVFAEVIEARTWRMHRWSGCGALAGWRCGRGGRGARTGSEPAHDASGHGRPRDRIVRASARRVGAE